MTALLYLDRDGSTATLQQQIRIQIVDAILSGYITTDKALPSSRQLAKTLNVARNTVVAVYDDLTADGYITSRERRGYFVDPNFKNNPKHQQAHQQCAKSMQKNKKVDWQAKIKPNLEEESKLTGQHNWQQFPYPFLYSQLDNALFPTDNWRKCWREAVSLPAIKDWSGDGYDCDDPLLIEQIIKQILPSRGIQAKADEILITVGSQQAIFLTTQLLLDKSSRFGIETPGYVNAEQTAKLFTDNIASLAVDGHGLVVDNQLNDCNLVYTTPSYQCPTNVTMPLERRNQLLECANQHDFLIIEDDYEMEINSPSQPIPALKSLDNSSRVVYIASLSKTLASGLRLGFIVGPREFIVKAKALRKLMLRHPPLNNQRAVALFIQHSYHDALLRKLARTFAIRQESMLNALNKHLPQYERKTIGGTSVWLNVADNIDLHKLQADASAAGILLNTSHNYCFTKHSEKGIKLGFSAIADSKIDEGIRILAGLLESSATTPLPLNS